MATRSIPFALLAAAAVSACTERSSQRQSSAPSALGAASSPKPKVFVATEDGKRFELNVAGKPFYVRGITLGTIDRPNFERDLALIKDLGANAIRTWGVGDDTQFLLDKAKGAGLKVLLGLWMRHGRPGAEGDDRFDWIRDEEGKQAQYEDALAAVRRYKSHPALLGWGVGNEVILNIETEAEKTAYAQFLHRVCSAIEKEDPDHPITSASAWTIDWPYWQKFVPELDIYGINTYGGGAAVVVDEVEKLKVDRPYLLTEFGARGEWDAPLDKNGLKIEPTDDEKWGSLAGGWKDWIEKHRGKNVGGFIFNFDRTLNHSSIWLNFLIGDAFRPTYWGARQAFTGKAPPNDWPRIHRCVLPNDRARPGEWLPVDLDVTDKEKAQLRISFHYNYRAGNRAKRDAVHELEHRKGPAGRYEIRVPKARHVVKVYCFVRDPYPNLSIAQTSLVIL